VTLGAKHQLQSIQMLFVSTFEKLWMLHKHIFQIHAQIFSRCLISFLVLFKNCHGRMAFIIGDFSFFLRIIYKKKRLGYFRVADTKLHALYTCLWNKEYSFRLKLIKWHLSVQENFFQWDLRLDTPSYV